MLFSNLSFIWIIGGFATCKTNRKKTHNQTRRPISKPSITRAIVTPKTNTFERHREYRKRYTWNKFKIKSTVFRPTGALFKSACVAHVLHGSLSGRQGTMNKTFGIWEYENVIRDVCSPWNQKALEDLVWASRCNFLAASFESLGAR